MEKFHLESWHYTRDFWIIVIHSSLLPLAILHGGKYDHRGSSKIGDASVPMRPHQAATRLPWQWPDFESNQRQSYIIRLEEVQIKRPINSAMSSTHPKSQPIFQQKLTRRSLPSDPRPETLSPPNPPVSTLEAQGQTSSLAAKPGSKNPDLL